MVLSRFFPRVDKLTAAPSFFTLRRISRRKINRLRALSISHGYTFLLPRCLLDVGINIRRALGATSATDKTPAMAIIESMAVAISSLVFDEVLGEVDIIVYFYH